MGSTPGAEPALGQGTLTPPLSHPREPRPPFQLWDTAETQACGPGHLVGTCGTRPWTSPSCPPLGAGVSQVLLCQEAPHRGLTHLGAGLPTAHYYSRYEFEVSQRVPKVIMSRHQQGDCVSRVPGQARMETARGGQLLPLAWLREAPAALLAPSGQEPPGRSGLTALCDPPSVTQYWAVPHLPTAQGRQHQGWGGERTCHGVGGHPGVPCCGQAACPICRRAVPLPALAPVTAHRVDAALGTASLSRAALIHI